MQKPLKLRVVRLEPMKIIVSVLIILFLLAVASCITTAIHWSGGYRPTELRLRVQTPDGKPVAGVQFSVASRGEPCYRYPVREYTETFSPKSDEQGLMILHQTKSGSQFGGSSWFLFWFVPMGDRGPKHVCTLSHPAYAPKTFPFEELLSGTGEDGSRTRKNVVVDGEKIKMYVVERTVEIEPLGSGHGK